MARQRSSDIAVSSVSRYGSDLMSSWTDDSVKWYELMAKRVLELIFLLSAAVKQSRENWEQLWPSVHVCPLTFALLFHCNQYLSDIIFICADFPNFFRQPHKEKISFCSCPAWSSLQLMLKLPLYKIHRLNDPNKWQFISGPCYILIIFASFHHCQKLITLNKSSGHFPACRCKK